VIRGALGADLDATTYDRPAATEAGALSRRGLLHATWAAAGVAVLATAGGTVTWLRDVSVLAVRSGDGPGGVPINKSAAAARVTASATSADYRLLLVHGSRTVVLTRADLLAMPQVSAALPIACVEGWSAVGRWSGVRVRDLLALVDRPAGTDVVVTSLQESGPYRSTRLQNGFVDDDRTLLALALDGEPLALDHGYPARLIAPDRPGVLQTKWVARLEVAT
jgi:DMSO/TMAO reductase YedYZ molybdopterin-dependent catalytic subunit